MSLTTDRNDPDLHKVRPSGQNEKYLILSEEEREKGFVRQLRHSYVHRGRLYDKGIRMLDKPEVSENNGKTYVAVAVVLTDEEGNYQGGALITQEELDQHTKTGGYIGGCGTVTIMGYELAATYARDPKFYGATFCCGCKKHLGVGEFIWSGTTQTVGS